MVQVQHCGAHSSGDVGWSCPQGHNFFPEIIILLQLTYYRIELNQLPVEFVFPNFAFSVSGTATVTPVRFTSTLLTA